MCRDTNYVFSYLDKVGIDDTSALILAHLHTLDIEQQILAQLNRQGKTYNWLAEQLSWTGEATFLSELNETTRIYKLKEIALMLGCYVDIFPGFPGVPICDIQDFDSYTLYQLSVLEKAFRCPLAYLIAPTTHSGYTFEELLEMAVKGDIDE